MKTVVIFAGVMLVAAAQRPSYAGSGYIGLPDLANRFKEDGDTSSSPSLVNRLDVNGGTTPKIPVDARGDVNLVNRLNTWPEETKPFWLKNAEHIERQRNMTRPSGGSRPNAGTSVPNRPNTENRFSGTGSGTDPNAEIDDFGNPLPNAKPSRRPAKDRFSGSLP